MSQLEELKTELTAPIKSFRLFAIEKSMQMPANQELLSCLEDCLRTESDPECQMLLRHAIETARRNLSHTKVAEISLDEFEQAFSIAPSETQLSLLSQIKVSKIKNANCDVLVPKLLSNARNEVVAAAIIKKFTRFWPESSRNYLEQNVFSSSKSLQIACIQTLMKRFPESLKTQLHKIVHVKDPVIRSLAIWSMGRFFPELAADFIQDSLEKGDYYSKATALQVCSTLDFNLIKQSILNLIFVEPDPRIFKAACTIVLNNPDKEIPFRLMEIITRSQKEKAKYLSAFLPLYCENLKASKICEDFATYMQTLEIHSNNLKARIFVHNCLAAADAAGSTEQQEAVNELKEQIKSNSFVRSAAYEYADSCQNPKLKSLITSLLNHETSEEKAQKPDIADKEKKEEEQCSDSDHALIKEFARARFRKNPETERKAREILDSSDASDSVKFMAFKAAIHLEIRGLYEIAVSHAYSEDENRISAGLEYLEKFHKDEFHEATQNLIHTESIVVRNTLINATSRTNPEYAKFLITHLLTHSDKNKRLQGLASTVQIDFSYIYPELLAFLKREVNIELIQACLLIFMANPRIDAIYQIKQLKDKKGNLYWLFDEAEKDLSAIVQASGIATTDEINAYFARQEKETQARRKAKMQARELVEVQNKLDWSTVSEQLQVLSQINMKLLAPGIILFLLFVVFALFNATSPTPKEKIKTKTTRRQAKSQAIESQSLPDKGKQTIVKLLSYDADNKLWNVEDGEEIQYKIFIKNPEQYAEDQQLAITIQGSRYSLTGQVLIFVDSAEKIN